MGLVLSIVVLAAGLVVALAGAISFRSDEQGPDVTTPTTPLDSASGNLATTSRFLLTSIGPDPVSPAATQGPTDPIPLAPATVYLTVTVTDAGLVGGNPAPASQLALPR
jgi:hypothetical protein